MFWKHKVYELAAVPAVSVRMQRAFGRLREVSEAVPGRVADLVPLVRFP